MADGPRADGNMPPDKQKNSVSSSENYKVNLKLNSGKICDNDRVKLSFYVEREVIEQNEECKTKSVAREQNDSTIDGGSKNFGISVRTDVKEIDGRKKRCVDRYDSSESSDSGVAVLSSAESGGCTGSDFTEPGSPYSPASSSGNSEDSASARMPAWACEPVLTPSESRKRHNLESIANRLQPKRPACSAKSPSTTVTTVAGKATKSQQGRITEYYNHKMKQNVMLKRDPSAACNKNNTKKKCTGKTTLASDFQNYISLFTHTLLDPKVLPETTATKEIAPKTVNSNVIQNGTRKNSNSFINLITKIAPNLPETEINIKPNRKRSEKNSKRSVNAKRPIRRLSLPVGKGLSNSSTCNKQEIAKVNGTVRWPQHLAMKNDVPGVTIHPLSDKNSSIYEPNKVNGVCNNGVQAHIFNNNYNKMPQGHEVQIPICSSIQNNCSNTLTNTSNLSPFVAVPQTVMLTTLRVPQNGNPPQQINSNSVNGLNRPITMGNTIASPNKINGQFVFPLMHNLNGTVVQIPNMMTKVNQNYVLPNGAHLQQLRQDQNLQPQPATQMLINGALFKISNPPMQQNYANVPKSNATTNLTYPIMPKNFNTAVPTVVVSKPNYSFNVGPSMYMPPSGYIINSMPTVKMCESQANIVNQTIQTTVTNFNAQPTNETMSNKHMGSLSLSSSSSSIPIPPVKPPDKTNRIILNEYCMTNVTSVSTNTDFESQEDMAVIEVNSKTSIVSHKAILFNDRDKNKLEEISTLAQVSQSGQSQVNEIDLNIQQESAAKERIVDNISESSHHSDNVVEENTNNDVIFDESNDKDISSDTQIGVTESTDLHNLIERTCSSMTNDSSESGIGTSVDSPTDSTISKEGDDDLLTILSVSVGGVESETCQKSPILKKPETIRFPAKIAIPKDFKQKHKRDSSASGTTVCLWEDCKLLFDGDSELLEHLQMLHVNGQAGKENFVCLWEGCKVRGRPSCSRLWLERHALSHGGNKPFKCIVEDCGRRFSTQLLLERHVNNHFSGSATSLNSARKSTESSAAKQIRRNGKKVRYRRTPWSARKCDYVDAGVVQGVSWRLKESTAWRLSGACPLSSSPRVLHCQSRVKARRRRGDRTEVLVEWTPTGVLEDEWVSESKLVQTREIDIACLPPSKKVLLYDQFCSSYRDLLKRPNEEPAVCVSGAAKRKQGRQYGGNVFWPSGR